MMAIVAGYVISTDTHIKAKAIEYLNLFNHGRGRGLPFDVTDVGKVAAGFSDRRSKFDVAEGS